MAKSRGPRRRHNDHEDEHEEHVNHEAWVIPYADMLTLLMALFLVLFAVGRVDTEKFKRLAESLRGEFGNGSSEAVVAVGSGGGAASPLDGGAGVFDMDGAAPTTTVAFAGVSEADLALAEQEHARQLAQAAFDQLAVVEEAVREHAQAQGLGDAIGFRVEGRGLVVTIVTDQVLFDAGRADLQPGGLQILDVVADALRDVPNHVSIEGHTDSRPISTDRYPSNWELSTARATSVLRYLVEHDGLDPARLQASGYADTRPIADESTPGGEARNRRVEVVVLADVSLEPVIAPASDAPPGAAPATTGPS